MSTSHLAPISSRVFCDFVSLQHFTTDQDFEGLDSINFVDYPAYLEWVELHHEMDSSSSASPTEQQVTLRQTQMDTEATLEHAAQTPDTDPDTNERRELHRKRFAKADT